MTSQGRGFDRTLVFQDIKDALARAIRDGWKSEKRRFSLRLYYQYGGTYNKHIFYRSSGSVGRFVNWVDAVTQAMADLGVINDSIARKLEARRVQAKTLEKHRDYQPGHIICLKCDKAFDSWDRKRNRICVDCHESELWQVDDEIQTRTYPMVQIHGVWTLWRH